MTTPMAERADDATLPYGARDVSAGAPLTTLDLAASRALAEQVRARVKECYRNAVMALLCGAPDLITQGCEYVEGYVCYADLPLPIMHGWICRQDGVVIDPTATLLREQPQATYYPALAWGAQATMRLAGESDLPVGYKTAAGARALREAEYAALAPHVADDNARSALRTLYRLDSSEGEED